jgi:hypothetical protein
LIDFICPLIELFISHGLDVLRDFESIASIASIIQEGGLENLGKYDHCKYIKLACSINS